MFKTFHEVLNFIESNYSLKEAIPMITGGVGYEEYWTELFEINSNLKKKKKYVKAIVYRLPSGNYELTHYTC